MFRKFSLIFVAALAALLLGAVAVWAQGDDAVVGTWEGLNEEEGEFYFADFAEDGVFTLEVFGVDFGSYVVDEEQHKFGLWDAHEEEDEDIEWVDYELDGERLIVMEDEMELPFIRVWKPRELANVLAGRWEMLMDEFTGLEELEEAGEEIPGAFIVDMSNNGTAMVMELDEVLVGTYLLDPGAGTYEVTIEDETESGKYEIDGHRMVVVMGEKELVFERVTY